MPTASTTSRTKRRPRKASGSGASALVKITKKAKSIRRDHPKMKWTSAIKQAAKQLYH